MKLGFIFSAIFLGALSLEAQEAPSKIDLASSGTATFELKWEPKSCITTPCPQFAVVKFSGKLVSGLGADIDRQNFQKSAMANFNTFFVKGSYERDLDHPEYLKIKVSKWYGIVKEDFSPAPPKR